MLHTLEVTAELKDWSIANVGNHHMYWGRIHGDKKGRWRDGQRIQTSQVVHTEIFADHIIIHTLNSVYRLWQADEAKNDSDEEDFS
jgi:hypothetical protein